MQNGMHFHVVPVLCRRTKYNGHGQQNKIPGEPGWWKNKLKRMFCGWNERQPGDFFLMHNIQPVIIRCWF